MGPQTNDFGRQRSRLECRSLFMVIPNDQPDTRLAELLDAERKAQERHERLVGYPDDVREAAHALWMEAAEAVRTHRARWRNERD